LENKQAYEKPLLRKVRLEVRTSVLATCNTSTIPTPQDIPIPGGGCLDNFCYTP
jgi:hypothetical protein